MDPTLVIVSAGAIALIMLFAQAKLFPIASTLQEILVELRKLNAAASKPATSPTAAERPAEPIPARRACPHCGKDISSEATKCGHCWKDVAPLARAAG